MMTSTTAKSQRVLILGGTGAVGNALLRELLSSGVFGQVTAAGRRPIAYDGPGADRLQQVQVDFEALLNESDNEALYQDQAKQLQDFDVVFCSLGTTRKQAGSAEAFQRIDRDYVLAAARATQPRCRHFLYVSSSGADANSLFLYPRSKGETEERLKDLRFPRLSLLRPAFLLTERPREGMSRPFESLMADWILPCLVRIMGEAKLQVPVGTVARCMVREAVRIAELDTPSGVTGVSETLDNRTIIEIGTEPLSTEQ